MGQGRTDLRVTAVYSSFCADGLRRIHALHKYSTELVSWRCHIIFHAHRLRQHLLQSLHHPPPPTSPPNQERKGVQAHAQGHSAMRTSMHARTTPCAHTCACTGPHTHDTHTQARAHTAAHMADTDTLARTDQQNSLTCMASRVCTPMHSCALMHQDRH